MLSRALYEQWGESPPKESPTERQHGDNFTKLDGAGQRRGAVQDARGKGSRMKEKRTQRWKASEGGQSWGESSLGET